MKNLKMAYKLGIGFGIVVLLSACMAFIAWKEISSAAEKATVIAKVYIPIIDEVTIMERETLLATQAVRTYSYSKNDADYETAMKHVAAVRESLSIMQKHNNAYPGVANLQKLLDEFPPLFDTYLSFAEKTKEAIQITRTSETGMVKASEDATAAFYVMQKLLHDLLVGSFDPYNFDAANATRRMDLFMDLYSANLLYTDIRRMYEGASATANPAVFSTLYEKLTQLEGLLTKIDQGLVTADAKQAINNVRTAIAAYSESFHTMETAWKSQENIITERLRVSNALVELTTILSSDVVHITEKNAQETATSAETYAATLVVISWVILLLSVAIAVFLTKVITKPLHKGVNFATTVAAGNLDEILDVHAKDELGHLADALRTMVTSLKTKIQEANEKSLQAEKMGQEATVAMQTAQKAQAAAETAKRDGMLQAASQLEEVVGVVATATDDLSHRLALSQRGSLEQASRVAETATAMEEMNSTVIEVARNASDAASVSASTREKAVHGAQVVQEVVQSMREVQQHSLALKEDMALLGEHANSINEIMGVISDIADQTNLLALNAAIEAARAGEAGRGFAVVADEVRKLAEKTMQSTTNVGNTIRAIQQSTGKSIQQVDFTVQNIEKATELANSSGEALTEIVHMVDNTADQVRAIATASEQQSASSEEINRSITQINTISTETVNSMQEASHAMGQLVTQAQIVAGLIDKMKSS